MFVIGLGTAAPAQRYAQRECWDALQHAEPFARLAPRSRAILKKVLCGDNGIATRHLALDPLAEAFNLTPDALQARFTRHAPALAAEAAQRALRDASCAPSEMDAVLISTCTGYLCPGLTSYVSERLGLRAGCFHAGFGRTGLRRGVAQSAHRRGPARRQTRTKSLVRLRRSLQRGVLSRRRSRRAHQRLSVRRRRGRGGADEQTATESPARRMEIRFILPRAG